IIQVGLKTYAINPYFSQTKCRPAIPKAFSHPGSFMTMPGGKAETLGMGLRAMTDRAIHPLVSSRNIKSRIPLKRVKHWSQVLRTRKVLEAATETIGESVQAFPKNKPNQ